MICVALHALLLFYEMDRGIGGRNIVVIVLSVDSCVQYEVDHVDATPQN